MRRPRTTFILPRRTSLVILAAALTAALTGCSRHTALTVHADIVPFLSQSERQTSVTYPSGSLDIKLPPSTTTPNPGEQIDLSQLGVPPGAASAVTAFGLDLAATITPTSDVDAGTASIYVAPSNASDAFQSAYRVAQVATPALPANQASTVTAAVQLDDQTNPTALQYVQSGTFRLGVEVQASASGAGSADAELTRMVVTVSVPPGWGLP